MTFPSRLCTAAGPSVARRARDAEVCKHGADRQVPEAAGACSACTHPMHAAHARPPHPYRASLGGVTPPPRVGVQVQCTAILREKTEAANQLDSARSQVSAPAPPSCPLGASSPPFRPVGASAPPCRPVPSAPPPLPPTLLPLKAPSLPPCVGAHTPPLHAMRPQLMSYQQTNSTLDPAYLQVGAQPCMHMPRHAAPTPRHPALSQIA